MLKRLGAGGPMMVILLGATLHIAGVAEAQQRPLGCQIAGQLSQVQELPEASGLAISLRTPGLRWSHNDSGEPVIFSLTAENEVKDRVHVTGAQIQDWESIAVAACPQGTCLYIADIGDNQARRQRITIYRTAEPAPGEKQTRHAEVLHAVYPDGPQDAEALIAFRGGKLFIVTKGDTGPVALYRFPSLFKDGATVTLERVATLVQATERGKKISVDKNSRVTGADVSPDGRWIVLRMGSAVAFYDAQQFVDGNFRQLLRFNVSALREPQGEGIAIDAKGNVGLSGEGGGKSRPGTLAWLDCTLP